MLGAECNVFGLMALHINAFRGFYQSNSNPLLKDCATFNTQMVTCRLQAFKNFVIDVYSFSLSSANNTSFTEFQYIVSAQ